MRAPTINFTSSLLSSLNRNNVQLNKLMDQFTQQKRVVNPSDDPLASTRLAQLNRDLAATKQYQTNIDRLSSSLSQQEVQVEGISNQLLTLMDKLREANNSTLSPEDMGGYATEINAMMGTMVSQLNSRDESGRYMFAGTLTNQVPVVQDASGKWVYQGNRDEINTVVGNGVEILSNTDLTAVFGSDLATLNTLQDLATKMADPANNPADYLDDISAALASVQQAESYLQATEQQVLALSHSITRRSGAAEVTRKAEQLQQLLADRPALSGGTVNRQLQVSLAGKSQVTFNLRDGEALLQPAAAELLTFSLAGDKREISAAALPANGSPQETLLAINQALGKWGIHGRLNAQRQPGFEVDEQQWSRVSQHLSVQGGGTRYPQGQFVPLRLQAEPALEQEIAALIDKPARPERLLPALEEALNTLTQQRRELQRCRGAVVQRIDSMATFANSGSALASAQQLAERLQQGSFQDVAQALGAQANVPPPRVRNVLS